MDHRFDFWKSVLIVIGLTAVLWLVFLLQQAGLIDTTSFGNWPRHFEGLKGVIFSPFIHGSQQHLISNTLPLLVLMTVMLNAYPRVALAGLVFIHLLSGMMVWLLAPTDTVHIGISGIIYGIAAFLVASGVFRKDKLSAAIAMLVTMAYGGMVTGFVPVNGISWQSHLYGALSGILFAYLVRHVDVPAPHPFELEKVEEHRHFFDELQDNERA